MERVESAIKILWKFWRLTMHSEIHEDWANPNIKKIEKWKKI